MLSSVEMKKPANKVGQNKLKILFSGMIAADPHQGGATWAVLQYVLGLKELGHEVVLVEPISAASIRPKNSNLQESDNAAYFRRVMDDFALSEHAPLIDVSTKESVGLAYDEIEAFARTADVLINISGMLTDKALIGRIPTRIYLDLDPAFIQLWQATQGVNMRLDGHTHFVTVGLAIGTDSCDMPLCGRNWITTLQPIVLSQWPRGEEITYNALTTVGNWRGYGSIEHGGKFYGQKAHSFREFRALPRMVDERFVVALAIHADESADIQAMAENGWDLVSSCEVAGTPSRYRDFIRGSKAEIGIAKSGYVVSQCGWFSDRSVCYLAAGRPVIAQDTGFSQFIPTGRGLLPFTTIENAARCIYTLNEDYKSHSDAARSLAETHFGSELILSRILKHVGVAT
jgi:hypothetical protein